MRIHITFFLFVLGITFYSCQLKSNSSDIVPEVPNEVVFIFQNCPPDINTFRWTNENGSYGGMNRSVDVLYADSTLASASTRFLLKKSPDSDTITISLDTLSNIMEVVHYFNFNEQACYLFHKGDSVLFTYKENIPYATVLNRETSFPESNYTVFIREHVTNNRITALILYGHYLSNDFLNAENRLSFEDKQMKRICEKEQISTKKQILNLAVKEVVHEYKLQDSLHNAGLLSDFDYDYRRSLIAGTLNDFFTQDTALIQNPDYISIRSEIDLSEERFAKFGFLRQLYRSQRALNARVDDRLKSIKPVTVDYGGGGGISPAYFLARFDTINSLDFLSAKSKHSFLTVELKKIVESGDRNDIETYCEKFIALTGDTLFINKLLDENKINFSNSDELLLTNRNNNQINFQEVLEKNKGKVIYIDFWASWCMPCVRSMPDAKLLREEYKDKDVTFVYLAFKDEKEKWETAEERYEVNYLSESYFITNSKTARILADWKIRTVPRYFLYNKEGGLVHLNAPGPHGNEIRNLLDKFLSE